MNFHPQTKDTTNSELPINSAPPGIQNADHNKAQPSLFITSWHKPPLTCTLILPNHPWTSERHRRGKSNLHETLHIICLGTLLKIKSNSFLTLLDLAGVHQNLVSPHLVLGFLKCHQQ